MYDLLAKIPNAVIMHEKENCPSTRKRSHWQYFHSLPSMGSLTAENILIDGCIDIVTNIKMRAILHQPENTFYVVRASPNIQPLHHLPNLFSLPR
jgi:hypothetical protein